MITAQQVTALTAQQAYQTEQLVALYIGDAYDQDGNLNPGWMLNDENEEVYTGSLISQTGVGVYGQSPEVLVLAGYVKPGALNLITSPDMTSVVLNTPAVWTGQFGINSLTDYLNYPILQNLTQISLLIGAYQGLLDYGVLNGNESARYQATFVQPAAVYGVDKVVSWLSGFADTDTVVKLKTAGRQGQYAIDFVDAYNGQLNIAPDLGGFDNTTQRETIDQAVENIIGNQKIFAPVFGATIQTGQTVQIPTEVEEDGTFRFAPGKPQA